jgi:hypothetical protein
MDVTYAETAAKVLSAHEGIANARVFLFSLKREKDFPSPGKILYLSHYHSRIIQYSHSKEPSRFILRKHSFRSKNELYIDSTKIVKLMNRMDFPFEDRDEFRGEDSRRNSNESKERSVEEKQRAKTV